MAEKYERKIEDAAAKIVCFVFLPFGVVVLAFVIYVGIALVSALFGDYGMLKAIVDK
ncbi:MAG: hypothetical protein GY906_18045 [bacterium]|nr:hypothetical protein [bacterium]